MSNKFDGDVRPLSHDSRYMGQVFSGSLKNALKQAKAAPEHGLPRQPGKPVTISRDRWNLLEHLNLSKHYAKSYSRFSLEYAVQRWPENFKRVQL